MQIVQCLTDDESITTLQKQRQRIYLPFSCNRNEFPRNESSTSGLLTRKPVLLSLVATV